jgi:glutathionyl-hydroquinone reductase
MADAAPLDATQEVSHGKFVRSESSFRRFVEPEDVEPGRYHLVVSHACPWACRCLAVRSLKGLEEVISVDCVHPVWQPTKPGVDDHRGESDAFLDVLPDDPLSAGWTFDTDFPGTTGDTVGGCSTVREFYEAFADLVPSKFTVPILFDKKLRRIVNNEVRNLVTTRLPRVMCRLQSSEIIRMFNSAFDAVARNPEVDLYPPDLRDAVDAVNEWVYPMFNNGVYRAGFAQTQSAYDEAVAEVFEAVDRMEQLLSRQRFLAGDRLTEADVRAFVTLVRFDAVYVTHFKCSLKTIRECPNLTNYMRDVYQTPGMAATVDLAQIRHHYQRSHPGINPLGIIAVCPEPAFDAPHDRERFASRMA